MNLLPEVHFPFLRFYQHYSPGMLMCPSVSSLSISFNLSTDQWGPQISWHRWATELRIVLHNVSVFMCPYMPCYPSRLQASCLSTSVCQTQAALVEVTGGAVPVSSVQRCANICHEAHVQLGGSRHIDVTAAMKTETGAGLSLLYWASRLSSSALIRDDGPRPPPPSLVYR